MLSRPPLLFVDPMEGGARDLLRRFSGGFSAEEVTGGDSDEIELGLSLGGCFSSQNTENSRLTRSSSIPAMLQSDFPTVAPLVRSCSLPSEAEEEIRRRREMQSIKRMEAKRKRKEKRKLKRFDEKFEGGSVRKMRKFEPEENGVESSSKRFAAVSQDSVPSQGSSSSGGSEFESQPGQGFEFPGIIFASDVSTHPNVTTTSKQNIHIAPLAPAPSTMPTSESTNNTILRNGIMFYKNDGKTSDVIKNMMEEMPSVSTRGDGPNGRRISGLLYRYQKGEVSIICVCHGNFLTPAEFVKHGGGGDVAHPLRHIVVNPSSGSFL